MAPPPKAMLTRPRLLTVFFVGQNAQSASPGPLPTIRSPALASELSEINIEQFEVEIQLSSLDVKKAAGDNGILTRLLRMLSKNVAPFVLHLFHLSLKSGKLPTQSEQATIIPIYHKGIDLCRRTIDPYPCSALCRRFSRGLCLYVCTHM